MSDTTLGLRLDPLDPLLFRDGRPFDAATRVAGGLPNPQVLAGALRTAMLARLGFRFADFTAARKRGVPIAAALMKGGAPGWWMEVKFRGPWVALVLPGDHVEPLLPLPQVVYFRRDDKGAARQRPMKSPMPGWPGTTPHPLWADHERDSKRDRDWVALRELAAFLKNDRHDVRPEFLIPEAAVHAADDRVGIEIDPHTFTAEDGKIYNVRFQALNRNPRPEELGPARHWAAQAAVAYYAEIVLPAGVTETFFDAPTPVPFGGEGRYAGVHKVAAVSWPKSPAAGPQLVYLASPAFLTGDPPLPQLGGAKLLAAASGDGVAVSGWDVARNGPRPTRFAVPAGACYFYDGTLELPDDSIDPDIEHRREGWGFALRGSWNW